MSFAIEAVNLSKQYQIYDHPQDRLKQFFWGRRRRYFREFWALRDVTFRLRPGEVLGVVGRNGAGKSTLLQLLCQTLRQTTGDLHVNGRIAALLELGAGFNPEFSGRDNVYFNASVLGLSAAEIDERFEEIVDFSGIRDFIDQPVKTYSSGMYVRLAFAVATSVDPDILVIDEALSVGDGEFARKSFDRIMAMRDAGKTIIFCSHSLYQVEALCERALWLDAGRVAMDGAPHDVVVAYEASLARGRGAAAKTATRVAATATPVAPGASFHARIEHVSVSVDGRPGRELVAHSTSSTVRIEIVFATDTGLPVPSVAVVFLSESGETVASAGSINDGVALTRDGAGRGRVAIEFPEFPLLKGRYYVAAILACENAIHPYEIVERAAVLEVRQRGLEKGYVALAHRWQPLD
ncbi:MAG: ABC transporter ATP-binding protein [Sulfurisoma sp.]|nr:ABC transporter ATP-binding protein [Sulfurisoma sp.]